MPRACLLFFQGCLYVSLLIDACRATVLHRVVVIVVALKHLLCMQLHSSPMSMFVGDRKAALRMPATVSKAARYRYGHIDDVVKNVQLLFYDRDERTIFFKPLRHERPPRVISSLHELIAGVPFVSGQHHSFF